MKCLIEFPIEDGAMIIVSAIESPPPDNERDCLALQRTSLAG